MPSSFSSDAVAGLISMEEFTEVCTFLSKHSASKLDEKQIMDLAASIDLDKNGVIDFNEFLEAFRMVDINEHYWVSMCTFLSGQNNRRSKREVFDRRHWCRVNWEEWHRMLTTLVRRCLEANIAWYPVFSLGSVWRGRGRHPNVVPWLNEKSSRTDDLINSVRVFIRRENDW